MAATRTITAKFGVGFKEVDVTDCLPRNSFEVSTDLFGDPEPGAYKFLELTDEKEQLSVVVGEDDYIEDVQCVFDTVPASWCLQDFYPFVSEKHGLEIGDPSWWMETQDMYGIYDMCKRLDNLAPFVDPCDSYIDDLQGCTFRGDAVNMPFKFGSFDFVLASHVLEHLRNPLKALFEMRRVLRDNGYVILVLPKKELTFDQHRPTTVLEELVDHFAKNETEQSIMDHVTPQLLEQYDFSRDLDAKDPVFFTERCKANFQNRLFHVHVFDFALICACLRFAHFEPRRLQLFNYHQIVVAQKTATTSS